MYGEARNESGIISSVPSHPMMTIPLMQVYVHIGDAYLSVTVKKREIFFFIRNVSARHVWLILRPPIPTYIHVLLRFQRSRRGGLRVRNADPFHRRRIA